MCNIFFVNCCKPLPVANPVIFPHCNKGRFGEKNERKEEINSLHPCHIRLGTRARLPISYVPGRHQGASTPMIETVPQHGGRP
jgi:hypothetical protein